METTASTSMSIARVVQHQVKRSHHRPLLRLITRRATTYANIRFLHNQLPRTPSSLFFSSSKLSITSPSSPIHSSLSSSFASPEGDENATANVPGRVPSSVRQANHTAVLLGWLGAEQKHLKRYADLYRSRGIKVVSFVVPPLELFGLDLGRRVERRIEDFTKDLISLVDKEEENDGCDSFLLFHTFSNTGWLTYGAILDNMESRADVICKIKGCVVDSGADPDINPQVWAAGFCTAILKKRSSLTGSSMCNDKEEKLDSDVRRSDVEDMNRPISEIVLLTILEKFFSVVLFLPDVNWRLRKVISILSMRQPVCPQLYLYSSADKVIPSESVELFIQKQEASGRPVHAYNFGTSPHVDHLRSFPLIYSTEIGNFLEVCMSAVDRLPSKYRRHCSPGKTMEEGSC